MLTVPAIISHYLLSERVRTALGELQPQLEIHRNAFLWGASGPDVFFCHRVLPFQKARSLSCFGSRMHNEPAHRLLNALVEYARAARDDIAMSYALGFITHYAFDSVAHPFVLYFSGQMSYRQPEKHSSICHNELEAALDSLFLRVEKGVRISRIRLQDAAPIDPEANTVIALSLKSYMKRAYHFQASCTELIQAQKDWHTSLAVLNDRTGMKRIMVEYAEKAVGLKPMLSPMFREDHPRLMPDYANLRRRQWFDRVQQQEHSETFFELADRAEALSLELIRQVLAGKPLTAEQCTATFSGH